MNTNKKTSIAWISIFGAIIGVTSFVPLIPYITGGGFLPLSISLAAIAPLILGFRGGIISALIGGIIGMFINPACYPFGFVDVFLVAMLPAIFCGFAFKGDQTKFRYSYVGILVLSGLFAEIVPYYYPGSASGFPIPPQPLYFLLVAFFWIPWLILYISPIGSKYLIGWIKGNNKKYKFVSAFIGVLIGLMPWCLWMIAPVSLVLKFPPELAIITWFFAAYSRAILSIISAIIIVPLIEVLAKSGMPTPVGAIWTPKR
jgi:hypothetical protein